MENNSKSYAPWIILGISLFIGLVIAWMAIMPRYRVWSREQNGKAELAEAQWNRQITVEEAQANLESQKLNAQAEVERARGASESQAIISDTLTEEYLRYLWIQQIGQGDTIYVPTEAGLPILEATRNIQQ